MSDQPQPDWNEPHATAPSPLEFLVGSWHRYVVLNTLVSTPRTRADLQVATGVSRPTLSRILSDLVDREWIRRNNSEYEATRQGEVLASEIAQLIENLETVDRLGSALEWIPAERLGFPLGHLLSAEVLTPTPHDQTAPMRKLNARIDATAEMRVLATGVTYEVVDAICQAGMAGELQVQCVLDDAALEGMRAHPQLAELFAEMIDRRHCNAYYYDGDEELLAYNLMDEVVMFCGISDGGLPMGILASENETVRAWAAFNFKQRKDESSALEPAAFIR